MAEAPTMEVRARLSAETAQFTRGMEQARKATEEFSAASNRLRGAVVGIGVVAGTASAALIAFGMKAFTAAARVDELDIALQAVGASTGKGYKSLADTAKAIKANGIEMEIAQKATLKFAQNNLDLAKAADVARVAQDLAVIGAMNSSDAFDRLTHAIITGRSEVLKSVGIQKSAGSAYAEYGAKIGKAAKDLTYMEKQAAVLNLVLEEGARVAGTYEAAMTTPGKVLRSFARMHNELQVAAGGVLLKGFGPLIFQMYELYKAFVKGLSSGDAFTSVLEAMQMVLVKLTSPIASFFEGLNSIVDRLNAAEINITSLAEKMEMILPVLAALGAGFAVVAGKQIFGAVPIFGALLSKLRPLPIAFLAMTLTSTQMRNAIVKVLDALRPLIPALVKIGQVAGGIGAYSVMILSKAIEGVAAVIRASMNFVRQYATAFKILGTIVLAVAGGYAAYRLSILAATAATKIYGFVVLGVQKAVMAFQTAAAMLNATLAFNPIPLIIGALVALTIAFAAAWKNSETFRNVMTQVFNSVAKVVGKVLAGVIRLIGNLLIAFGYLIDTNNTFGKVIANVFQFIWNTFLDVFIGTVKLIKFVIDGFIALMENQGTLGEIIENVVNFIIKSYLMMYKVALSMVKGVLEGFIEMMENHATFRKVVETVFNSIVRIIGFAVTSIITTFANILKGVATVVYFFEQMFSVIKSVWTAIVGAIQAAAAGIGNIIRSVLGAIVEKFLTKLIEKVRDFINFLAQAAMKIPGIGAAIAGFFNGMSAELTKATTQLKSFSNATETLGKSEAENAKKNISVITLLSNSLIDGAKSWGNYESGAAGAISGVANKLLNFNQKVVQFVDKVNTGAVIDALVSGAKTALPVIDAILSRIDDTMQVNFGKAVVDTLVKGAKLASDGLGKVIDEMERLREVKVGDFVQLASEKAIQAGEFLLGLATGIESFTGTDFVSNLGDAFQGLIDKLKEGLGFGDVLAEEAKKFEFAKAVNKDMEDAAEGIGSSSDAMQRIREAMQRGIQGLRDIISDLQDAAKEFADSLKETIIGFAGLKGVELPDGFVPQAKSLIENMRMRLNKSQQFAQQIAQLQAMNLDAGALKAIIEEGPIKGAQLAASILSGGAQAIAEVNQLQKAIAFTGAMIGGYGADVAYSDLINNAQAKLSQIEAASLRIGGGVGGNVYVSQGAVQIVVDASMTKTADEMADVVTARIEQVFATLAKELAAK